MRLHAESPLYFWDNQVNAPLIIMNISFSSLPLELYTIWLFSASSKWNKPDFIQYWRGRFSEEANLSSRGSKAARVKRNARKRVGQ